jgi:hypothetical protein
MFSSFLNVLKISAGFTQRQTTSKELAFIFYSFIKNVDKVINFYTSYYVLI